MIFDFLTAIFIFIIGAIIGSFLNVCIYRLPKKESIVMPPSHCPVCKTPIAWFDNIPLISFLALGGRCRQCKKPISPRYFVVELIAAFLAVALYLGFGFSGKAVFYAVMVAGLIVATFVDFEIYEIPDQVSLGGIAAGCAGAFLFPQLFNASTHWSAFLQSLLGVVAGGGSIYLMGIFGKAAFKKEAMGGGDVKLMAMIGSFIGWKLVLVTFFIAPFFGSAVGIIAKYKYKQDIIPYGPYLSLGAVIALFFGDALVRMVVCGL